MIVRLDPKKVIAALDTNKTALDIAERMQRVADLLAGNPWDGRLSDALGWDANRQGIIVEVADAIRRRAAELHAKAIAAIDVEVDPVDVVA